MQHTLTVVGCKFLDGHVHFQWAAEEVESPQKRLQVLQKHPGRLPLQINVI